MARIKKRRVAWDASPSPGVVGYRLYWTVDGSVSYNSEFAEIGNVTEISLPEGVSGFPFIAGRMELGLTALDESGNESDMTKFSASFHFVAPEPPKNPVVETVEAFYVKIQDNPSESERAKGSG
jgi:hypothetical protein